MTTKQEIAAINLSKFRKAQVDLTETQERADLTEQAYAKYKARGRSASIARDMWKQWVTSTENRDNDFLKNGRNWTKLLYSWVFSIDTPNPPLAQT